MDLHSRTRIRMVSLSDSDRIKRLLEFAQRDRMDEKPTVPILQSLAVLHYYCYPGAAILGSGDLCEFHLFQQYQPDFHQDEAS